MTRHKASARRREEILHAATTCFTRNGYHRTRIEEVAREAGLSKGGLYFHFASKDALFDAIYEQHQQRLHDAVAKIETSPLPPEARLFALADLLVADVGLSDERRAFSLILGEKGLHSDEVRRRVTHAYEHYLKVGESLIAEGIASGRFRPVSARAVAQILKYLVDGMEYGSAMGFRPPQGELVATFVELMSHGLLRHDAPATSPVDTEGQTERDGRQ